MRAFSLSICLINFHTSDHLFKNNDIMLKYNNFTSSKYEQMKSSNFVPGLSIIDPLMNLGFNGVKEILYIDKY